ncbi:hypothetical protein CEP54_014778 [Fusarium duplospermum]|uniref:Uncharacterized protein n=1 Tax=Fusarium duplospermum TaxID=1325734 RepID=A0A428NTS7_9HYPO|nr:hypothetical protein CEP54_014778 [Fusarium duplospermum]
MWLLTRQKARHREEQRRLNSVPQQQRYLTETLSSPSAIWTLTSIKLPKTPEADFKRDANNPPCRGGHGSKTIRIKGYVVHIDMILHHEVTYKLTKDTIDTLTEHHKELYCVEAANDSGRPDREQRGRELHKGFVQAINKFILRTHVSALRGLKEGGTGKILEQRGDKVKETILSLMNLPCPRAVDAIQQNSVFPMDNVCSQFGMLSCQTAIELWKVPSSGSDVAQPTSTDDCLVRVPMAQCNPAPPPFPPSRTQQPTSPTICLRRRRSSPPCPYPVTITDTARANARSVRLRMPLP